MSSTTPTVFTRRRMADAKRDLLLALVAEYLALPLHERTVPLRDALTVTLCDWYRAERGAGRTP